MTKSNPTKLLKVPEGLFCLSNKQKILSDVIFYYHLKSLNVEGVLPFGQIIHLIRSHFNVSESSTRRKLKQLLNLGFIKKYQQGYSLINYDTLWKTVGLDVKQRGNRRGKFKIFKIPPNDLPLFYERVSQEEIAWNLFKQQYRVYEQFRKGTNMHKSMPKVQGVVFSELPIAAQIDAYLHKTNVRDLDVTLSCLGVAKLMGCNTAAFGCLLQKRLEKLRFIHVERRKCLYRKDCCLTDHNYKYYKQESLAFTKEDSGLLYYNMPNKLLPL